MIEYTEEDIERIRNVVKTALEKCQKEYNKNRKWYQKKIFDYDSFLAGFKEGITYLAILQKKEFLEEDLK